MFKDARVGDRVWSVSQGWGVIADINKSKYPVVVEFKESGTRRVFTYEGRWVATDSYPTLFWDEVKIVPPPKPVRIVKKTAFINVYDVRDKPERLAYVLHETRKGADACASDARIACVQVEFEHPESRQ